MLDTIAAMARTAWMMFWALLVVWGVVLIEVGGAGDEDRAVVTSGGGVAGGGVIDGDDTAGGGDGAAGSSVGGGMGVGAGGMEERVLVLGGEAEDTATSSADGGAGVGVGAGDTATPHVVEVGESSRPGGDDTPIAEEGQASDGGDTEDAFRDLPELSSGGRAARLRQSTLLEAFASSSRMGQPDLQMGEAMEEEDHDSDEEFVVGGEQAEADDEEESAEEGEPAMQGRRPAKRHRHLSGVGASGWDTLLGGGPLEGYRRRPSAMLRFRTIAARQVH